MKEPTFHHRSTLKQKNKPFKSRFATKSSQRDKAKGRTQRASVKGKVPRKHSRLDRRNAVRTEQRKKREQLAMATRIFSGRHRAPKIVAVVPLCADSDTRALVRALFAAGDAPYAAGALLDVPRFKQTLRFVEVGRHALDILDAAKAADYVVVALSAHTEVDAFGEHCLRAMQNQGHAGVFPVVQGLDHVAAKRRMDVRRSLQSFVAHFCPDAEKVHAVDAPVEGLAVLRMLTAQAPRAVRWRDTRPYLLADHVDFAPSADSADRGLLAITGYLRGANLSANRLVHVPSFGDFQIEQITAEPLAMEPARGSAIDADDSAGVVLDRPDPAQQDSLVAANEPDAMQNEQTWPEDHEMAGWDAQMAQMDADEQRVVRVPRGTSAYQAAWIAEGSEGSDASDDDDSMDSGSSADGYSDDEDPGADEYEDLRVAPASTAASEHGSDDDGNLLSADEEAAQLRAYLQQRAEQSRSDQQFPDEVDTPLDRPARERFARFRGLQSFRTSPWDAYENLPLDYARIFQFENFRRTQQRVLRAAAQAPVRVGARVRVVLRDVPRAARAQFAQGRPFVVFGLHQYEHQMSVVNFAVARTPEYAGAVRSKDPLVAHYGFRRYVVQPLFSQHLRGGATVNNVHKFERFLQPGQPAVATAFAPIQFGAAPVALYLPEPAEGAVPTLVATGKTLDVSPARIVAKRVILTGAPYKIHKRGAVVRFMFFNPEDVGWFKPVQIYTKHGRVGHIRESLGTHGYMKCAFDGPIKQMDTVCMNLYKRVFPKWTTRLWAEHEQTAEQLRQWAGPTTASSDNNGKDNDTGKDSASLAMEVG